MEKQMDTVLTNLMFAKAGVEKMLEEGIHVRHLKRFIDTAISNLPLDAGAKKEMVKYFPEWKRDKKG